MLWRNIISLKNKSYINPNIIKKMKTRMNKQTKNNSVEKINDLINKKDYKSEYEYVVETFEKLISFIKK